MPDTIITVGAATITPEIADTLARMQRNSNEDLNIMIGNISDMKRFFISLNGSDLPPSDILGQLGNIQYIEDYLAGLKTNSNGK